MLTYLLAHPGRAFSRTELLADVWGWEFGDQSTVTVHVRRLREKIETDPTRPDPTAADRDDLGHRLPLRPGDAVNVLVEVMRAAPLALLFAVPVALLGGVVVLRMRRRSMNAAMTALVLVPLTAALAGVLGTSGFMYTPMLAGTVAVVAVVAAVTVPAGMWMGRQVARETMWQRQVEASRRELVARMSHDLRSPLARIRGMTDALLDGVVHRPAEVTDYLERIRRESVRMAGMVEDIFQLSRATSGALRLPRIRLALGEVVSGAVAVEATTAAAAGVRVAAVDPERWPTVLGSDTELTRVVRNLLANAIHHTPDGGLVRLSAGVRDGTAWLQVQDACGGIPDGDLERIFDAGYRGSAARTPDAQSGSGLGLAIARALAEAQQGGIQVRNSHPGCLFELTLPTAPHVGAAPPARVPRPHPTALSDLRA